MSLETIAKSLNLTQKNDIAVDVEVTSGYASDLLSDVLANAKNGTLWLTNQKHQNIIGVAVMLNLSAVVIAGGLEPEENTLAKSIEESIPLYTTPMSVFELAGKLYEMGGDRKSK